MIARPTEPGNYHWRFSDYTPWQVVNVHRGPTPADGMLYQRPGIARGYPLTEGIWGPRIPDPTKLGEIPAGGLTADEANHLHRLMVAHSMDTAVSSYRGRPDDPTLESVLSAALAEFGFTRQPAAGLTDAEIVAGLLATDAITAGKRIMGKRVAVFRRAVAEAREAGK